MRRRLFFPLIVTLLAGLSLADGREIDPRSRVWSDTRPAINLTHIFAGEINRRGEHFRGPSGYGYTIEGYVQNGRIRTAYPIYSR